MKTLLRPVILFVFFVAALAARSQYDPKDICRIDDNQVILKLDRNWTSTQTREVMKQFDIDSSFLSEAFSGKAEIIVNGVKWSVKKLDTHRVELSKPMDNGAAMVRNDVYMLDDRWINAAGIEERESAAFGINVLSLYSVFNYHKGVARFFLPQRKNAQHVSIAGTFNNWSTMQSPMVRCDSGWFITLRLKPGKFSYKYIIDGVWSSDPYNKLREDDTQGGENCVVFCYNYRFFLPFSRSLKDVFVAGSFNSWNPRELRMYPVAGGWALNLFLREGTHAYKFFADNQWFLDPSNKIKRPDGAGHENSFVSIGDTMYFTLKENTNIKQVNLAGNFNAWNGSELSMEKVNDGWQLPYVLAAGNYEYKFILDGKWITDPDNPYSLQSGNSFIAVKPNHLFAIDGYAEAKKIIVAGSFNGWNKDGYQMVKKEGKWVFPIYLKPGKHTYKFVVDGKWILDPGNDLWENNQYGTDNSVLWIEP